MVSDPFNVKRKKARVRRKPAALIHDRTTRMASPRPPRPHRQEREQRRALKKQAEIVASGIEDGPIRLFGVHAVDAALRNPKRDVLALSLTENGEQRLGDALAQRRLAQSTLEVIRVTPRDLDRLLGADTVHQGMMVEVAPLPEPSLDDLAEAAAAGAPIIALDQVTDPHNAGAVLRSAAVFGAGGLLMTRRHSPPLNGTLAKSASGALELVPIHLAQNLSRTLQDLKARGLTLLGLDGAAEHAIEDEAFEKPCVLVLGAEGKGLRQLTRDTCDRLVKISPRGPLRSLNVSNAAAVALHLAAMKRR
jgi:23S rRNA (guanosine2251-2'-O)-methyltransferase